MKKIHKILYTTMFVLTMCFLFMSAIQREFKIFETKPLNGVLYEVKIERLNLKNFYNFTFQKSLDKSLERSFGFREPLIRLYNQYTWDFYRSNPSTMVLIGKDNWLYPNWHLKAVPFTDELKKNFDMQVRFTHQLTGILKEYNTELLVCFIPGKTEIYPEYMKKRFKPKGINPIEYYCEKFDEYNINYIDLTKTFFDYKDTAVFKPFTQTGTHWSNIASVYAIDSVFKTFEKLSNLNIAKLDIGTPYNDSIRTPDNDLELLLNLMRPLKQADNYYVDINLIKDSTTFYPKMITIGDSHFWNISYNINLKEMFSSFPYWYYGNTIYFDKTYKNVDEVNLCNEFINSDYVLLLYSSHQTYTFGSGVLISALLSMCIDTEDLDATIESNIRKIKSDANWVESLEKKATKNKISFEDAVYNDAMYMIKSDPYKYFKDLDVDIPTIRSTKANLALSFNNETDGDEDDPLKMIINEMKQSKEWMNVLREKAKELKKPLDDVMIQDAKWLLNKRENNQ